MDFIEVAGAKAVEWFDDQIYSIYVNTIFVVFDAISLWVRLM